MLMLLIFIEKVIKVLTKTQLSANMCNVFGYYGSQNAPYTPILTDKILLGGLVKRFEVSTLHFQALMFH